MAREFLIWVLSNIHCAILFLLYVRCLSIAVVMGVCNTKIIITKNGNEIMDKCRHMSVFYVCI